MKVIRALWLLLGFACFGLGALGAVLPVLPTVPFLLAASFFFAKGSKRFHRWLCGTKLYQDHLEHFARTHEMTAQAKALLLGGVTLLLAIPFCLVDRLWVRGAILLAVCIKYWYLLCRVKTAGRAEEEAE